MTPIVYSDGYRVASAVAAVTFSPTRENSNGATKNRTESSVKILMARLEADAWVSFTQAGAYRQFIADLVAQAGSTVTASISPLDIQPTSLPSADAAQVAKNQKASQLILEWLAEDSGYDEEVWPILQKSIEENRLSYRSRFHE
jgi:hypothetical protein